MTISAILVDDEPHARQALKHLLGSHPEIKLVAECENGLTAVKAVHELQPEVIFLDIQMPKLDGFDVLELLGDAAPLIVFVTAHDEFAIQAFENNALDYLLKPVSKERLASTIDRITSRLATSSERIPETRSLVENHQQALAPINRILVRDKGDVFVVPTGDVIAIEAADDYVVIHTLNNKLVKQERLGNLERLLDSRLFCRIHRSSIINLDYLAGIETEGKDTRFANMRNGLQLVISRSGYAKLIQVL